MNLLKITKSLIAALVVANSAVAESQLSVDEARQIGRDGYVFGFPMVENYKTMFGFSIYPESPVYSGFNTYQHNRKPYDPDFKLVVTPNNDTLYSTTFADLRAEPLVITVPPTGDRYFSIQLVDFSTNNFAYIGTRETGRNGGTFVLVGPNFKGSLIGKDFDRIIISPSQFVALATRTAVNGPEDATAAATVQDGLHLTPLSSFLETVPPEPAAVINFPAFDPARVESIEFFDYLDIIMDWHTPRLDEEGILTDLQRIGVSGGGVDGFDAESLSPKIQAALHEGMLAGRTEIEALGNNLGERIDGWEYTPPMGNFGTDYLFRSAVAWKFLYTHSPEEAVYPIANVDADGAALEGGSSYALRFKAGSLPPVDGFWSVTMYDGDTRLLIHNDIKRYSIGDRTKGLAFDTNGDLALYFQHISPGADKESNWLPTPEGKFYVILRAYVPSEEILSGAYRLPPIEKVD
ncbi:MAG: DUF1254 domain-containing protein [Rhodobacteraceae bacterium]|nr:DUF1254 domain-containing protein [Paracoccaceae bacterium]